MKQSFYSLLHRLLIKKSGFRFKNKLFQKLWQAVWDFSVNSYKGAINYRLYGESIIMNNGYLYPLYINTFYSYNHPLIEITYQVFKCKKVPINYVDIGAAIGDTMLLLFKACPDMINFFYCIEGDDEFYYYQTYNLRNHSNGKLIKALLSDQNSKKEKSLIRTHSGTASAQGNRLTEAVTLDELLLERYPVDGIDLIKIDVDGLDGKVINGAKKLIYKFKPAIIFEFHPILIKKTGNSIHLPFWELVNHGYTSFIFFDKYGKFNHLHYHINNEEIDFLNQLCLRGYYHNDWHYDVISIHNSSHINIVELAESTYSSRF